MPHKILIVPDKFKGTLTAFAAAEAIARGWRKIRPNDSLELLPMTDGGDGFGEVLSRLLNAKVQTVETVDAAHRPCKTQWWWEPKTKTAVIESANVIGLAMLPAEKFHPFELDTFGLGEVIRTAVRKGAKRCLIGIGGSATNDGGFGLARSLGWKFLDGDDSSIKRWTNLHQLSKIRAPKIQRWFDELIVAVDVQNPLLGPHGATRVYGPQKGLRPTELAEAEKNLRRLVKVCNHRHSQSAATIPGSGAAGGLGFGLLAFLKAQSKSGFELFSEYSKLDRKLQSADLVITGEGCIDKSTVMGKGVGQILRRCHERKIPCIGFAGSISNRMQAKHGFKQVRALTDLTTLSNAKTNPAFWLELLAERTAHQAKA